MDNLTARNLFREELSALAERHIVFRDEIDLPFDGDWFGMVVSIESLRGIVCECECFVHPPLIVDYAAVLDHCQNDDGRAFGMLAAIVCHHMAHTATGSQDHDAKFIRLVCHAAARLKLNQISAAPEWLLDWPRHAPSGPEAYRNLIGPEVSRFIVNPLSLVAEEPIPAELDEFYRRDMGSRSNHNLQMEGSHK